MHVGLQAPYAGHFENRPLELPELVARTHLTVQHDLPLVDHDMQARQVQLLFDGAELRTHSLREDVVGHVDVGMTTDEPVPRAGADAAEVPRLPRRSDANVSNRGARFGMEHEGRRRGNPSHCDHPPHLLAHRRPPDPSDGLGWPSYERGFRRIRRVNALRATQGRSCGGSSDGSRRFERSSGGRARQLRHSPLRTRSVPPQLWHVFIADPSRVVVQPAFRW